MLAYIPYIRILWGFTYCSNCQLQLHFLLFFGYHDDVHWKIPQFVFMVFLIPLWWVMVNGESVTYCWDWPFSDDVDVIPEKWCSQWAANGLSFLGKAKLYLVGGLVAIFYFPIYWEFHHPNWLIFFRGVQTTNQICMELIKISISSGILRRGVVVGFDLKHVMKFKMSKLFTCQSLHSKYVQDHKLVACFKQGGKPRPPSPIYTCTLKEEKKYRPQMVGI